MHPRKFVRDSVGYAFAQYVVRATIMLRGLIAARFLGPEAYGAWNAIQILMDYGPMVTSGTQQGLDQLVPPRIVAGDPGALDRVKRAALFNITLMSALFIAAVLAAVAFGHSRMLHQWGFAGVGAAAACALTVNLAFYQISIMRSHGDITTASTWMLVQGGIGGALGLALLPWLHEWSLLLGWLVGCTAALAYSSARSRRLAPMAPRPAPESVDLVRFGFPMFVFTASALIMRNLDRLIILRYISTSALGYYSLSVMALMFLMYLPDSISYVLYPRLLREYGESGRQPAAIRERLEKVLQLFSTLLPMLCGVAFLAAQPLVWVLLPKFLPGVGAMRVLCFGAVALAFMNLASIVLVTVGRQLMLMPAALFGVVLYAAFDLFAVKSGFGITGVAWATLSAYGITSAVMLVMALVGLKYTGRRASALLARLYGPLLLSVALCAGVERLMPWAERTDLAWMSLRLLANLAVFAAVYLAAVAPFLRGMGVWRVLSEFNVPLVGAFARRFRRDETSGGDA